MSALSRSRRSPRIDDFDNDCMWLGRTRRPWPLQAEPVLPVDDERRRRLRREEEEDLRKYRTSLQYDPWARLAARMERQQRAQQIDPDEEEFVQTMRREEQDRASYAASPKRRHDENPGLTAALLQLHPDELADLLDDPESLEGFVADHAGI